jgi:hypothetical protein
MGWKRVSGTHYTLDGQESRQAGKEDWPCETPQPAEVQRLGCFFKSVHFLVTIL